MAMIRWLLNLFPARRDRLEHGLDREIQYHLDRRIQDFVHAGLAPAEARRRALLEFGGVAQVREDVRDAWLSRSLRDLARDVRYAVRVLSRSPGFTLTALLSLALGIGANTAIFGILHALILRSLPVSDPQSLVVVARNQSTSSPYPLYEDLRDHGNVLQGVLAFRNAGMRLSRDAATDRVTGALVSGTFFSVLGVQPSLGTVITPDDDRIPGSGGSRGPVAVISHDYWLRRFAGSPAAIGARILLNDHPFTVVGVAPPGFDGLEVGEPAVVFAPMMLQQALMPSLGNALSQPRSQWLRIFARLDPAIPAARAEAGLTTLLRGYNELHWGLSRMPEGERRRSLSEQRIVLLPGGTGLSQLRRQYARPLWVLVAVVALVLLIACANLANLSLSRAAARAREIAVRLSLGAARGRLLSQLLIESLVLSLAGAALGLLLAVWMRDALIRFLPPGQMLRAPIDLRILLFTFALSVGAALFFGLAPALHSASLDLAPAIKGVFSAGGSPRRFRRALVAFQVALSLLLLIGAALFLRSLHNLLTLDPGFTRDRILVATVEGRSGLPARLLPELQALPGVLSAAFADSPPLGVNTGWDIYIPGYRPGPDEPRSSPSVGFVSPGYFETMGIPLLLGRDFDRRDLASTRDVMIVNQDFAAHYFGAANPIGRRVGTREGIYSWEIVGVVRNSKYSGLREDSTLMVYVPSRPGPWASRTVIHLRTAGDSAAVASSLRRTLQGLDPTAALFDIHSVREEVDRSLARERLVGAITGAFGALALLLAAIGLYGLTSFAVARRTREFGIRIAVGARAAAIVRLVVAEVLWLLLAGVAAGLAAAVILGRLIGSLLYGIQPADPLSAAAATLALAAVALFAAWIPARRASRVDPVRALRAD